ncbi:MAG: hypothetical protein QNJ40_20145 [Xanthomonadales bacterium]|nr:hypothetical protein [Xanthomonadales bacterium]
MKSPPDSYSINRKVTPLFRVIGVLLFTLLISGCFFRSLVGFVDDRGGVSLSGNVQAGFCDFNTSIPEFFGCTYTTRDESGRIIEIISSFELITEFGLLGALIDPLILQLPDSITSVSGTYNNAGFDQPLDVSLVDSFPVLPGQMVSAEPGTQFAILELPDAVAAAIDPGGEDFDFTMQFDATPGQPVMVKPMLTASVDVQGTRYYLPMLPCVTDFAQVPEMEIPVGTFFQDLRLPAVGLFTQPGNLTCDEVVYDFENPSGRIFADGFEDQP